MYISLAPAVLLLARIHLAEYVEEGGFTFAVMCIHELNGTYSRTSAARVPTTLVVLDCVRMLDGTGSGGLAGV